MSESEQAPIGQSPATGGRARQYANGAERARAWRERQRLQRTDPGGNEAGETVTTVLAEASLAVLLERLTEVGRAHEAAIGELIGRVEDAVGALADPDAVAEALAAGRAEAARQVAEAEARAVRAGQARTAAETAARDAVRSRTEAEEAATGAWERAETLEAALTEARRELDTVRSDAARELQRHENELVALRAEHAELLGEAHRESDAKVAEVREAARIAVDEANAGLDRAEGTVSELRVELEAARRSAEAALATARTEAAAARSELAEQLAGRYEAERAAAQAEADAHISRAQVRAESAQELAENRASEISRLVTQVEDLRADLRRARHDT